MSTPWFLGQTGVPFGDPHYDTALNGSHDMTVLCPPNTPVTAIAAGTVSDISAPSWGKQVCIKLDTPIQGHDYFCLGLHLSATEPSLKIGDHVAIGQLIGWSGGCTEASQYDGTSNPTGENFLDTTSMSSQPQVGIALHDGPAYGGEGWVQYPPIDDPNWQAIVDSFNLDPEPVLAAAIKAHNEQAAQPTPDYVAAQAALCWGATERMLRTCYGNIPAFGSIAYNHWHDLYVNKKANLGPPVTPEVPWIDWNNRPGTCMWFASGARIEIIEHVPTAYDVHNVKIS